MAAVQSITAPAAAGQKVDAGRTRLAENFEMFLTLLTTQLKNQDPLAPMDGNQFTQQLVQMTSVEQQLVGNDLLREIAGKDESMFGQAVDMIGKGVTIQSADATLAPDGANWSYELPFSAKSVSLEVRNSRGEVVWTAPGSTATGRQSVEWDGRINGKPAATGGVYRLTVKATDSRDAAMTSKIFTDGLVTGVEQKGDQIQLSVGRSTIPMSAVQSVWLAVAAQQPQTGQTTTAG